MRKLWNDGWSFLKTEIGTEKTQLVDRYQEFEPVNLPHDWLIYDTRNLYEDGTGWYRKIFFVDELRDNRYILFFEGIYMDSTIYVNGETACQWKYGYSSFSVDMTEYLQQGENEVLVRVCFQSPNSRWYSGAGIYRDVWFSVLPATYLPENATYISTKPRGEDFILTLQTEVAGKKAEFAEVQYRLLNQAGEEVLLHEVLAEETGKTAFSEQQIPFGTEAEDSTVFHRQYLVTQPALWDIEHPVLYTLCTTLVDEGEVLQEEREQIGFRTIAFLPEKGFFLNGRNLKLNGVCEHHDLGALGAAFNKAAMRRKMRILKEMGVNAIRGSHNMMAPGFVQLADEMGILLISEAFDMWERSKNPYDYARFFPEWWEKDVESWVKRDRNHPSVILRSIGNEIYDTHADKRGQELTAMLKAAVERYDPCRNAAVTIGSNYMPWENAQKCADIVKLAGYNYSEKYYREHHEKHPDWIIYGSETSSIVQSRGVYHFPLKASILADEDEQCSALGNSITSWGAKSMEDCIVLDRDMEFSMGQFIWTGFDYIGEPTPYHTKNSYFGQIDTAGFPKDSYYVWQSAWTDYHRNPMVHVFPYWDFNDNQPIDVRVCSNAPFVELFVNGRSQGRQRLTHEVGSGKHLIADYQVPYEKGILLAVAYDENEIEIAREEKRSFGNSRRIVISPENTEVVADGRDLLFLTISTLDEEGNSVENACDRVQVEAAGAGRLIGLDNGDSTDYDQYKGKSRRLFNGKLLAIVQAGVEAGAIKVSVTGKNLEPATVICQCVLPPLPISPKPAALYQENCDRPILTGTADEIPVRKITLTAKEGTAFSTARKVLEAEAVVEPPDATDQELFFETVNEKGVVSNLVTLQQNGNRVSMTALGDGTFYLRCKSRSGTEKVRIISQLAFSIQGMGQAYLNPYDFISGSSYTSFSGEVGNGNERGVATARDGETVVSYGNIDFGSIGSDEITIPIFALSSEAYPIQIWEGIPREENSVLLAEVVYQKPSVWNVYQPETYHLAKKLTGITTVSFLVHQKIHIKGFSFTRYEKAWMRLSALDADAIYGDSFQKTAEGVEEIGNNVSLVFSDMDFGEKGFRRLVIKGRARKGNNTIHVRFCNGQEEIKQIVEFAQCDGWEEQQFALETVRGRWDVTFVFLPGSCFDFAEFCFSS